MSRWVQVQSAFIYPKATKFEKRAIRNEASFMEPIIPLISEVGFPIAVTLYLLYRIESKLDVVVQSIQGLPERLKGND